MNYHFVQGSAGLLCYCRFGPGDIFCYRFIELPGLFSRTADDDSDSRFPDLRTIIPGSDDDCLRLHIDCPRGLEYAAAGASFGAAPGAAAGLMVLIYFYWRERPWFQQKIIFSRRCSQEVEPQYYWPNCSPGVAGFTGQHHAAGSGHYLTCSLFRARLEVAGYTVEQATELFGYLTGMAVPLMNMATILTASLAVSLVPAVSTAFTLRNIQEIYQRTATAMRIANLITIPAFVGMWLLARPISQMLYGTPNADTSDRHLVDRYFSVGHCIRLPPGYCKGLAIRLFR